MRALTLTRSRLFFFRMRKDEGLAARDGTNEGCQWNAVKADITAFVDFAAGGIIGHEFEMRGIERAKAAPMGPSPRLPMMMHGPSFGQRGLCHVNNSDLGCRGATWR